MSARDRLDAIQQRADAATEGPWHLHNMGRVYVGPGAPGSLTHITHATGDDLTDLTRESAERQFRDAVFIAHARQDVPALVGALRAVLDLADRWEHGATRWADPLPVPLEVEQVRRAITDALGGEQA